MPAFIDEQPFYDEVSGVPLAGGFIYIGAQNGDPKASPITIYSDRELTVPLANPQTLDANGRSPTKIWIPETYSMRIDDINGVQKLIDLDAGVDAAVGNRSVTGVSGINTILGMGGITQYTDGEVYIFKASNDNTAAVTLNIDSVGAKSIVTDDQQTLIAAAIKANATIMVVYNSTNDNFRWINPSRQFNRWYKGADIVSATNTVLGGDGNYFDVTGATTIATIATRGIGFIVKIHFDATLTLTHHATDLILPGGVDITTAAGDEAEFIEYAAGDWRCTNYTKANGLALRATAVSKFLWPAINSDNTTPDEIINIGIGQLVDSTGFVLMNHASALAKDITVAWDATTGGLPTTVTLAADTTYHAFIIAKKDGTVNSGFDTSISAVNLLAEAGYDFFFRLHSFSTDSTSDIVEFKTDGDRVFYQFEQQDAALVTVSSTSTGTLALTVPNGIPVKVFGFGLIEFVYSVAASTAYQLEFQILWSAGILDSAMLTGDPDTNDNFDAQINVSSTNGPSPLNGANITVKFTSERVYTTAAKLMRFSAFRFISSTTSTTSKYSWSTLGYEDQRIV